MTSSYLPPTEVLSHHDTMTVSLLYSLCYHVRCAVPHFDIAATVPKAPWSWDQSLLGHTALKSLTSSVNLLRSSSLPVLLRCLIPSWYIFQLAYLLVLLSVESFCHILELCLLSWGCHHQEENTDFATCGSHVSAVSLFYGIALRVYISAAVTDSSRNTTEASVMYSVISQVLNPFIYSLSKRKKEALRALMSRTNSILCDFIYFWLKCPV